MSLTSTRPDTARAAKSLPRAILSFGSRVLVASIAAFCILLLAIRYVVFPQLESHRGQISDLLAQQIGQPVELGALASGWDGWNPRVEFRLENRFGRHRFGLTGVPPAEVAAPIDIRGDVRGRSLGEWHASSGRLYARLDYADVAAWRVWLPLPIDLRSGKGALRVWLEYAGGEPREIVADLVLTDVETRLAPELRELALARLEGRIGWRSQPGTREFFTKRLTFAGAGGARFDPTDFKLTLHDATAREIASGTIEFNNLQLAPLTQVAENLPLPKRWREDLARYNPKGTLTEGSLQWNGEATAPDGYAARGQFTDLGLAEQDGWPGLSGVTGSFEATQKGGSVRLASRAITVELPRIFDEKLALDSIQG